MDLGSLSVERGNKMIVCPPNSFTTVDSSALMTLGQRAEDALGNEYQYVKGVASCAAQMFVSIEENALVLADSDGMKPGSIYGVAMGAIDAATKYGWVMVKGSTTVKTAESDAAAAAQYLTATAGTIDDAVTANKIIGLTITAARDTTAGTNACTLAYPSVIIDLIV